MQDDICFVLVEDEPLILGQLEYSVIACDPHFRVAGKAGNGRDGLTEIERCKPDVVITDIQMPVMSGLEMIAKARHKGLESRYLILSGYSEFQYARQALRLGVDDYLLKPIDPDALVEKLLGLAREIENKRAGALVRYLRSWFVPGISSEQRGSMPEGSVCYFIFADAGAATSRAYSELSPGAQLWRENTFDWLPQLQARWAVRIEHFGGRYANEHVFAVIRTEEATDGNLRTMAEEMLQFCQSTVPVCMIVTAPMRRPEEFQQQMRDAVACRMMAFPFGEGGIWCMETDCFSVGSAVLPPEFCALAARFMEQAHSPAEQDLAQLESYWMQEKPCQAVLLRQLEYLLSKLKDGGCGTDTLTAEELLADAVSFPNILKELRLFLRAPVSGKGTGASAQIGEIKRYIDENYDKPLSYRALYEKFGYNEKYIAYLFKKEIGISPSKYIVSVRIEAAKRLLLAQPGLRQKEVAQKVGFTDPLYFSRVFRDCVGVSPSRFVQLETAK